MIVDKIENAGLYTHLSKNIDRALTLLQNEDFSRKKEGKHEVESDRLYYLVGRYTTKPPEQNILEAHKKYIDIQYVSAGMEQLLYAPITALETTRPYDEATDAALYKAPQNVTAVNLHKDTFCILFPQDGHLPGCQIKNPSEVTKIVVKVKINV